MPYIAESTDKRHQLDVYRKSDESGPKPVFIYIHGGGFRILSKDTHWMMTSILAHQGFCVFSVNYGLAPKHAYPEGINDVFEAVLWIAQNAERFGGDISQVVVGGESAGANLTCGVVLAHTCESDHPLAQKIYDLNLNIKAFAPACGLLEVSNPGRFDLLEPNMPQLYRDRIGVICESYLNGDEGISPFASPLLWFESEASPTRELPPCFIGCGDKDPVLTDSQRLIRALEKRNAKFESRIYPNAIHAFQAFFWQENAIRFWREQLQFIAQFVSGIDENFPHKPL